MLADDTIEPALEAAGEIEVRSVNREHERIVENGPVEPVGYDEFET
jgi:hypothetical protein